MGSVALLMFVVAGFLIYEVVKGIKVTPPQLEQLSSTSSGSSGGSSVITTSNGFTNGLPSGWFQALFANESTLPTPGHGGAWPAFGISDPTGVHAGPGINGTNVFKSSAAPGYTPPLRLFNSMDEAVSALFNDVLGSPRYASALSYGRSHPGDCLGFFTMLGNAGYASPSDMAAGWPSQVCNRVRG